MSLGDGAEERLVTMVQAELVQRVSSGVGEIVTPMGLLAQDGLASTCPQCERTALSHLPFPLAPALEVSGSTGILLGAGMCQLRTGRNRCTDR